MSRFAPDMHVQQIQDIDFDKLWQQGIRGLVFDLDNTVVPWHSYDPDSNLIAWFDELKQRGFAVCILSNSHREKVDLLKAWLDIPIYGSSGKPRKAAFAKASRGLGLPPEQLAMIGDQLLTDIYGGKRAGFYTIFTEMISVDEFWGTRRLSRPIERLIKQRWQTKK